MSIEKDTTSSLIASLSEELTQVKVQPHPLKRILPWLLFATAYISLAIIMIGLRDDISDKIYESMYVFEVLLVVSMSMSAAFCSSWLCCPDIRGQSWIVAIPLSLAGVLTLWLVTKASLDHYEFPILKFHLCYIGAVIFGLIPAFTIWFLSQRGKTTHPYLMGVMNVISIGGLGYLALRIVCPAEEFGHIFVYHVMPYALFGLVITFVASRIYRWQDTLKFTRFLLPVLCGFIANYVLKGTLIMDVKIYKPSKNPMQSGRAVGVAWVLEYETESPRQAEPLMGWTESGDTLNQVRLKFKSCEDAVSFAENKGWGYTIIPEQSRRVKPRNYGDNFKYVPPGE